MKKTKLTRSLLAACSIVALSAVMYGCTSEAGAKTNWLRPRRRSTKRSAMVTELEGEVAGLESQISNTDPDNPGADRAARGQDGRG